VVHCGTKIYEAHGIRGLYRGFYMLSIRALPVNAMIFLAYEALHESCRLTTDSSTAIERYVLKKNQENRKNS